MALGIGLLLGESPAVAEVRTLAITATVPEGATIPPGAVLEVDLLGVSRADAPSTPLASQRFRATGWPALIRLRYDSEPIDARMEYRVAARLVSGDRVLLRTTSAYPVLTRNAPAQARIELADTGAPASPGR